jgi:nucleoside-diphosphate-sugar epimerase
MNASIKSALVTGGAGFIGSHIVEALVADGCRVTVLDNLSSGHAANLEHLSERITFVKGDICDLALVEQVAAGCEVIFHEAAVVSVTQTVKDPLTSAQVNDLGTLNVLEAARRKRVRRVVLASSSAVYGDDPELPKHEGMMPKPMSPYAVQKLAGELYAGLYDSLYGLETVCLRYFNVYGPRQDPSSPYSGVISIFLTKAAGKQPPTIYGDGRQSRDFVFVKDVVNANLLAATAKAARGGVFNVGTGQFIRIAQLWDLICQMSAIGIAPEFGAARVGDILESVADIRRAENSLGFIPRFSFEKGLKLTLEYYRGGHAL